MATSKNKEDYIHTDSGIGGQYKTWFLDYASYVILERAVPALEDGLKPVQRRILHAMKEMDDGRFNKVANIIGQSMQYHPHGDASIGDALVNLGQKDLLVETQGNWGDVRTGDDAAAPRYIEARLSKFALEVAFNSKTTDWTISYDGRKNEPVTLPMKFPLLLAQGAEGIAVGLATKILPHNFCELIEASIRILKGKKFELLPDFMTGGTMDATNYNDGKRGGKIRVRAIIEELDKKTLVIKSVPFGVTTTQLMESIVKANDQGKIKIKKVLDHTASAVEIIIELAVGISPDITIDALYAFTDCEISISPNACVIVNDKPQFLGVQELLKTATENTDKKEINRFFSIIDGEFNIMKIYNDYLHYSIPLFIVLWLVFLLNVYNIMLGYGNFSNISSNNKYFLYAAMYAFFNVAIFTIIFSLILKKITEIYKDTNLYDYIILLKELDIIIKQKDIYKTENVDIINIITKYSGADIKSIEEVSLNEKFVRELIKLKKELSSTEEGKFFKNSKNYRLTLENIDNFELYNTKNNIEKINNEIDDVTGFITAYIILIFMSIYMLSQSIKSNFTIIAFIIILIYIYIISIHVIKKKLE